MVINLSYSFHPLPLCPILKYIIEPAWAPVLTFIAIIASTTCYDTEVRVLVGGGEGWNYFSATLYIKHILAIICRGWYFLSVTRRVFLHYGVYCEMWLPSPRGQPLWVSKCKVLLVTTLLDLVTCALLSESRVMVKVKAITRSWQCVTRSRPSVVWWTATWYRPWLRRSCFPKSYGFVKVGDVF